MLDISNLVTLDMGASTDVSTIVDGREKFTTDFEIEWGVRFKCRCWISARSVPAVDPLRK